MENYARQLKLTNIRHYIDDDESGRFFDRSAYSRMMDDVENGKIGVCIMKDLTRWGRDYLQVGNAMEIFRRNNVRFIAVNNGIDSEKPDTLEFAPFINIMSEWYAKDISKKVKTGIKTKGMSGKPIATEAPYGYMKDPDNKDFWIIDEEAAEVVRLIFRLFIGGKNRNQIAVYLKNEQILSYAIPIVILLFFLFGSFFAPHDPTATNIRDKYLPSSAEYPFGTDDFGRCEFSRILEGGKTTLGIVLVGSAIVILLGILFGILLAKTGRRRNILAESILNAVTAIPPVAYLIIFIGIWGNSIPTMLVALTASLILRMIKLVKTLIEVEYDKAYIMCAIACGASKVRIMLVHILPNIIRDIVQFICLSCAEMIIAISGFSFIGLSLGDDVIDWGVMLSDARALAGTHPQLLLYPILFIFISSLCFNYLGRLLEKEGA